MFFVLTAAAAAATTSGVASKPTGATVRVLNPAKVSEELWMAHGRRKEVIIRDDQGQQIRLRLIEYE